MKICSKCEVEKDIDDYPKTGNRCKSCMSEYRVKYRDENKVILKEKSISYYYDNKEKLLACSKEYHDNNKEKYKKYREDNKEKISKYHKEWREENKDDLYEYGKAWREENKEKVEEYKKVYYEENKEYYQNKHKEYNIINKDRLSEQKKEYGKKYREENKEIISIKGKKYREENKDVIYDKVKNRLKTDELFKLKRNVRCLIKISIRHKGYRKNSKTIDILGCSFEDFKLHLESKFEDWMTWENRGLYNGDLNYGWDIDHIIPMSSAKTEEEVLLLNHYTNLQPLCSFTNRYIKKDNY